jgi:hypothetical protein
MITSSDQEYGDQNYLFVIFIIYRTNLRMGQGLQVQVKEKEANGENKIGCYYPVHVQVVPGFFSNI